MAKLLMPYRPPDDYLEFPANAPLENLYHFVGSGLAAHRVVRDEGDLKPGENSGVGFRATQLDLFNELDWHGSVFRFSTRMGG